MDFHKICNGGTLKLLDVQCKCMFKLDCKILSYGCFKIFSTSMPWVDPDFFVSLLYISAAIKDTFLKFNMFNKYKNNISKLVLAFFSNFKIVNLKWLF